jgi:hypothetical protein
MEAIILILVIGSFAWWCFSQGSKPREIEKRKEVEARSEDMYRRYIEKDGELRASSLAPSAKGTAPTSTRPDPSPTAAPSASKHSAAKPLTPDQARRIAANIAKLSDLLHRPG